MKKEKSENYLREIIFIIFVQKKIIQRTTLCLFVVSVLIAFFWPPTYSATGSILVRGKKLEKSPEALEQMDMRSTEVTKEDLAAEVEVLMSPALIEKTINALKAKGFYHAPVKVVPLNEEIHSIKQYDLKTVIAPTSNVIEITYFSKNKDYAVSFLQTMMEQYLENRLQLYHPEQTEAFYTDQASKFRNELVEKEDELIALVERSRSADPLKELQKDMDIRTELEQNLEKLRAEGVDQRLFIEQLNRSLEDKSMNFFSFIDNDLISSMSTDLQDILQERGRVLRVFTEQSDKIKLIDNQIKGAYAVLRREVGSYRDNELKKLETINTKIKMLEDRVNSIIATDVELKKQSIKQQSVDREISLRKSSYDTFAKRREEAKSATAGNVPSLVSILNKAFPSNGAIYPKKRVVIPLGVVVGFLMGFSFGFLRHYFDHTFKKPTDVEHVAGLNVIFSIPFYEEIPVVNSKSGKNQNQGVAQAPKPLIKNEEEKVRPEPKPVSMAQEEMPIFTPRPTVRQPGSLLSAALFNEKKPEVLTEKPEVISKPPGIKRKKGDSMSLGLYSKIKRDNPSIFERLLSFVR